MGHKKLARRFEPRYGVSQVMLETETKYVAREMDDYLLLAINDLKEKLDERGRSWSQEDDALEAYVNSLPEREKLAMKCIIVRDFYLLNQLYLAYLRSVYPREVSSPTPSTTPMLQPKSLAFSEWLFGSMR